MSDSSAATDGRTGRVRFGTAVLDLETRQLFVDGRESHITPKAFELLALLIEQAPRALTKAELMSRLWPKTYVSEDALSHLIADLRSALGDSARAPKWIRTVHGYGYAFLSEPMPETPQRHPSGCSVVLGSREHRLNDGDTVIGRDPDVDVLVASQLVSRRHARIVLLEGVAYIEDLESKNGTRVGEVPVTERRRLEHGDVITVGDVELTFVMPSDMPTVTHHQRPASEASRPARRRSR